MEKRRGNRVWAGLFAAVLMGVGITVLRAQEEQEKEAEEGRGGRGYFGIQIAREDAGGREGVLIARVVPGGPLQKVGLRDGDRILRVDGHEVKDSRELIERLHSYAPEQQVKIEALRETLGGGSEELEFEVTTGEIPERRERRGKGYALLGVRFAESDEIGGEGMLISDVTGRGPAQQAGIRGGDRILAIDGKEVEGYQELVELIQTELKPDQKVTVSVLRSAGEGVQGEGERLEFEVTLGFAPQTPYTMQFKFNDPLSLAGILPPPDRYRQAAAKGVEYILSQQKEHGYWKQIPKYYVDAEAVGDGQGFIGTSGQSVPPWAMTALCGLALRAHRDEAPQRVQESIDRAVRFLLDHGAERMQGNYAQWSWLWCIDFLCGEYHHRTDDPEIRSEIRNAVGDLVRKLLTDPSMGQRLVGQSSLVAESPESEKGKKESDKEAGPERRRRRLPPDGGWAYYQWTESVSFMTADIVLSLLRAREIGVEVPGEAIDAGAGYIEGVRKAGSETEGGRWKEMEKGKEWYAYRSGGMRGASSRLLGGIGRLPVCELALVEAGKRTPEDLKNALALFLEHRGELDKVRGYPGNHAARSYMNAAYYFLYTHYHAAQAANALRDPDLRNRVKTTVQEVILSTQEEDGTWTDHPAWGNLYGTAMALMALGESRIDAKEETIRSRVDTLAGLRTMSESIAARRRPPTREDVRKAFEEIDALCKMDRERVGEALEEAFAGRQGTSGYYLLRAMGAVGGETARKTLRKLTEGWFGEPMMGQGGYEMMIAGALLYRMGDKELFEDMLRQMDRVFEEGDYAGGDPGSHRYNTACLNALAGRESEALSGLQDVGQMQLPRGMTVRSYARQDPDLFGIWDDLDGASVRPVMQDPEPEATPRESEK